MNYKLSKWNSYIDLGKKSGLIYNAYTDRFIAVKEASEDYIHAKTGDTDAFSERFRDQMIEAGALVSEARDEVEALEDLIRKVDDNDNFFNLIINPTLDCNFHCWYCYENHVKESKMTPELIEGVKTMVAKRLTEQKNMKRLHLSFFGGEPLLMYEDAVLPLVSSINRLCKESEVEMSLHFTTNSFLLTDEMIKTLQTFDASFQITLDGGRKDHDNTRFGEGKQPSFDVIMDNIRKLSQAGMHVTLRINFTRKNLEGTDEIIDMLAGFPEKCRDSIRVDYQRVWQDERPEDGRDTEETVKQFRTQLRGLGYPASNSGIINLVRDSCYGDKTNEMLVNFNGDIYACTARDFLPDNRLGHLLDNGEIEWNETAMSRRRTCKFRKPICRECRIAPLCGGGCRTKCLEHSNHDGCNLGYDNESIDNRILEMFEERFCTTR